MPAMRMIAVTGDPMFMLMGKRRAIVAAGPRPGSTPTAVPSPQPMKAQRRFTGLKAIPNPCDNPAKSNMVMALGSGSEQEAVGEGGLEEADEHGVDHRRGGDAGA